MDSRLIYTSTDHLKSSIAWQGNAENEWTYFDVSLAEHIDFLYTVVNDFLEGDTLYLVRQRNTSEALKKAQLRSSLEKLAGKEDFSFWNIDLNAAVEFSRISVFRKGRLEKGR